MWLEQPCYYHTEILSGHLETSSPSRHLHQDWRSQAIWCRSFSGKLTKLKNLSRLRYTTVDQFGGNPLENKSKQLNKRRSKVTPFDMFLYGLLIFYGERCCQLLCYQLLKRLTLIWLLFCFPVIKPWVPTSSTVTFMLGAVTI